MRLGAALAYYSVFSAAPLIMIVTGIVGAIYGPKAAQGQVAEQLKGVVGPDVAQAVQQLVANASQTSKGATIVGFILLLIGASGAFAQLKESLNTIWEVKPKPNQGIMGFVRTRLLTFGMVLVIGFLMLASLILSTALTALNKQVEQSLGIPPFVSGILAFVVPFLVEVLLFAMIFKLLPDAQVLWKNVWVGAVVTALLFEVGKAALTWYLSAGSTKSTFGATAAPVLLLVWVYYTSLILFFGAEFTEVYARATGHVIEPKEHATRVTPEERAEQGLEPDIVPHPSAAAAMAGREPNTGVKSGGSRKKEFPADRSPLSQREHTPKTPPKERIAPLRAHAASASMHEELAEQEVTPAVSERRSWLQAVHENPFTEIGAALGLGLLMGMISRAQEARRGKDLSPGEHLRIGAKAAAIAGATAIANFGPKLSRRMRPKAMKEAAEKGAERIRELGHELPRRVEEVLK